jgi:organic radical activating enzyme
MNPKFGEHLSAEAIMGACYALPSDCVVLTGDDPLEVPGIDELVNLLLSDHQVLIEAWGEGNLAISKQATVSLLFSTEDSLDDITAGFSPDEVVCIHSIHRDITKVLEVANKFPCVPIYIQGEHPRDMQQINDFVARNPYFRMSFGTFFAPPSGLSYAR